MKKVLEVSLAGISFTIEDDAYIKLKDYLSRFEKTMSDPLERKEVMEDVEARVAEIFQKESKYSGQIVDERLVQVVIDHLGEIDSSNAESSSSEKEYKSTETSSSFSDSKKAKRFYRDPDDKKIAGVCGGLSAYFNIDVTLLRVIFLVSLLCYGSTLIIYLVIWIVTGKANTISQKLELRGIPVTAENIRKYTAEYSSNSK